MDCDKIVVLEENFLLERIDGEIAVYHPTLTTSMYLNDSGALIWELCDGRRTVGAIVDILLKLYPESSEQIARDVQDVIEKLVANKIARLV